MKTSQKLVHVKLDEKRMYFLFKLFELFLDSGNSARDKVHDYVKFSFSDTLIIEVACEVTVQDSNNVLVLQVFNNLQFSVFHFFVLH